MELENMSKSAFILNQLQLNYQSVLKGQKIELDIQESNRFSQFININQNEKPQNSDNNFHKFLSISKKFNKEQLTDYIFVEAIKNIQNQTGKVKVIGKICKAMKLKSQYFQQYTQIKISDYIQNENTCYLEDKSGRIKLQLTNCKLCLPNKIWKEIKLDELMTGILVLIEGQIIGNNIVNVENIYLPDIIDPPTYTPINQTSYVCFISGLNYDVENDLTKLRHLIQYLQGNLYCGQGNEVSSNLSQIIIVGNLYGRQRDQKGCLTGSIKKEQDFKELYLSIQENVRGVDELIYELASICPVAIMPGQNEPVSQMLPQTPLQRAHFGESFEINTKATFLTNPTEFSMGNIKFLGTSGQNIEDLKKYSTIKQQLEIDLIEMTLFQGHIAPTLQDTLMQKLAQVFSSQQKFKNDPFVIQQFPNIYFVGNMKKFGTRILSENLRIISVPSFSETNTISLLNLRTFECFSLEIK